MPNNPKVSVIMSVHNGMPFLKESVQSILNQTYKNFELIIVDDHSSDNSKVYLKSLKDKRIRLVINDSNIGLAASLNKALNVADGKFIARMDDDDISMPNRLEEQYNFMAKNPSVSICGTWAELINEKGKVMNIVKKPIENIEIKKMNLLVTGIIHPTWFLRKDVYTKLKGYDESLDMVEDFDFLIRANNFKMANLPNILLKWRSIHNRRSNSHVDEMYKKSFSVKWKYFKKSNFSIYYASIIIRSFITTFLFPRFLKIYINKRLGLL